MTFISILRKIRDNQEDCHKLPPHYLLYGVPILSSCYCERVFFLHLTSPLVPRNPSHLAYLRISLQKFSLFLCVIKFPFLIGSFTSSCNFSHLQNSLDFTSLYSRCPTPILYLPTSTLFENVFLFFISFPLFPYLLQQLYHTRNFLSFQWHS